MKEYKSKTFVRLQQEDVDQTRREQPTVGLREEDLQDYGSKTHVILQQLNGGRLRGEDLRQMVRGRPTENYEGTTRTTKDALL